MNNPKPIISESVFGSDDRYYASREPDSGRLSDSGTYGIEKTLTDALLRRYPDLKKIVERTYRRWNPTVREILRTETGLRLSVGENHQAVPVKVIDGLPHPFWRIFQQAPDQTQWDLALHQPLLIGVQSGLAYIKPRLDSLADLVGEPNSDVELAVISELVDKLVAEARRFNLLHAIMSIDEDILGAYFFYGSTVNLYWLPIGIVSTLLGISVEALTVVVLAHELAHAYTHLGLDIDGQAWDAVHFAGCDHRIVEGLAQFYASAVCKKIAEDYPAPADAFNKLLEQQSPTYCSYVEWIEAVDAAGELVRHCLIQTRTQPIRDYPSFLIQVGQGKKLFQASKKLNGR